MNAADLKMYGLKPVARVHIEGKDLKIKIVDLEAAKQEECIYAFLLGDGYFRIGSSKEPLRSRLKDYVRDISHALKEEKSPAPPEEAEKWRKALPPGSLGVIYARRGTMVKTLIGEFPAFLDEESILIGKLFAEEPHDHILNRNKHR
ncbi:MAG: hypothetical protein ACLQG3_01885 [Terracidiphilus sp.]